MSDVAQRWIRRIKILDAEHLHDELVSERILYSTTEAKSAHGSKKKGWQKEFSAFNFAEIGVELRVESKRETSQSKQSRTRGSLRKKKNLFARTSLSLLRSAQPTEVFIICRIFLERP